MKKYLTRNRYNNEISKEEEYAMYIIENNATVRQAAKYFQVSKSSIHARIQKNLRYKNYSLYKKVSVIFDKNKAERHIRGGLATKRKYRK